MADDLSCESSALLAEAGIDLSGSFDEPTGAAAIAAGRAAVAALVATALTPTAAVEGMGVLGREVEAIVAAGAVATVGTEDGVPLPEGQFVCGRLVPGPEVALRDADGLHPLACAAR